MKWNVIKFKESDFDYFKDQKFIFYEYGYYGNYYRLLINKNKKRLLLLAKDRDFELPVFDKFTDDYYHNLNPTYEEIENQKNKLILYHLENSNNKEILEENLIHFILELKSKDLYHIYIIFSPRIDSIFTEDEEDLSLGTSIGVGDFFE